MQRKRSSVSLKSFVGKVNEEIRQNYAIEKVLGEGAFSIVYKAKHRLTGLDRCIKKISKSNFTKDEKESIMNEIKVLTVLDHPHVVKIIEYYESERSLYLVTEYLEGSELFDKIQEVDHFTEDEVRKLMKQILGALAYMYKKKIVHRDLKPENIIIEELDKGELNIKIIDFGTSKEVADKEKMKCKMGTPYYIAPEVIRKNYDIMCDVWSVGVIMYILFCGYPPFNGSNDDKIMKRILTGKFVFPDEEWSCVSKQAKNLIKRMIQLDPKKRPTAQQLLEDEWFKQDIPNKNLITQHYIEKLKNFKITSNLRNAIQLYFVNYFDLKEERQKMQKIFETLDTNSDGQLTKEELMDAFDQRYGLQGQQLAHELISKLDFDHTDSINFSEFLVASFDPKSLNENHLQKIFTLVDADKNGQIDKAELMEFFHFTNEQQVEAQEMIDEADIDHDGLISYKEFKALFEKQFNII